MLIMLNLLRSLYVELHREKSVNNRATPSSLLRTKTLFVLMFNIHKSKKLIEKKIKRIGSDVI